MTLRVGGGFLKGRVLTSPRRGYYRPATARLKTALFAILNAKVREATVLDLFAGIGSLGIEALSRGAKRVTFVERDADVAAALEANIRGLALEEAARVHQEDVFCYLDTFRPRQPYDLIFADPPYGQGLAFRAVEALSRWVGFGAATVGIIKTFKKEKFAGGDGFLVLDERIVGEDLLTFFSRSDERGGF